MDFKKLNTAFLVAGQYVLYSIYQNSYYTCNIHSVSSSLHCANRRFSSFQIIDLNKEIFA